MKVDDDILKVMSSTKLDWAGRVARMKDNRWTVRCTEWQVRNGKRSRGRLRKIWHDDIQHLQRNMSLKCHYMEIFKC